MYTFKQRKDNQESVPELMGGVLAAILTLMGLLAIPALIIVACLKVLL
jgi:hypothetical protein